ncbi:hypothetical protein OROHE_004417 [Orobanche hederae]
MGGGISSSSNVCIILTDVTCSTVNSKAHYRPWSDSCLSWRLGVETNNIRGWRTVPSECLRHVKEYLHGGQYERDLNLVVDNIISYADNITLSDDGLDAWILDVDDTCNSNLPYYSKEKQYGYGHLREHARPVIPGVQRLFNKLINRGFAVFLVTGRDEETFRQATTRNLQDNGYSKYKSLIEQRMQGSKRDNIQIRNTQLVEQHGFRIQGNVGDEWSDLLGDYPGNRTFKLPNPMYFVP